MLSHLKKTCFLLLLALFACQQTTPEPTPTEAPEPPPTPMVYEGQALGSAVKELKGISLVAVADSLTEKLLASGAPEGVYFIMLSQKIPDQGIIVKAPEGFSIEDVKAQKSGEIELTGAVKTLQSDDLAEFAKDRYEMRLATDESGVLWVENSADLNWKKAQEEREKTSDETETDGEK